MWSGHHHQAHAARGPEDVQRPGGQRALQRGQVLTEDRACPGEQVLCVSEGVLGDQHTVGVLLSPADGGVWDVLRVG